VRRSRYCALAVLDVEDWSGRSAVNAANVQRAVKRIEELALAEVGINPADVRRQSRGDGSIRALPGGFAKEVITDQFVEALRQVILDYDADCDPRESIRARLSLHAGDVIEGDGEWAGQPVIVACRLVDSALIKRVLAAAPGSPLALVVSSGWYDAVVREGHASGTGYQEVWIQEKTFADTAWVKVPGRTRPPGLQPEDDPRGHRRSDGARSTSHLRPNPREGHIDQSVYYGNTVRNATVTGDIVFGDKSGGDAHPSSGGK
jgi:hypothetical protein